jgi:translocation and assembly module TamB
LKHKKWLIIIPVFSFVSILFCIYCLLATSPGTQLIFKLARPYTQTFFSYDHLSGSLLGNLTLSKVKLRTDLVDIHIEELKANTSLHIFHPKLVIQQLALQHVTLSPHLLRTSQNTKFTFPIELQIRKFLLQDIQVHYDKKFYPLPDLISRLKLNSKGIDFIAHQIKNPAAYSLFQYQGSHTKFYLHMPINKTLWNLSFIGNADAYVLKGDIKDGHAGALKLEGKSINTKQYAIRATANRFNLIDLWPHSLPGNISYNLLLQKDADRITLDLEKMAGKIKKQSLWGEGHLVLNKNKLEQIKLNLQLNNKKLITVVKNNTIITWSLEVPELTDVLPQVAGKFIANGSISNLNDKPMLRGEIWGNNLATPTYRIKNCSGAFSLNIKGKQPGYFQLNAHQILFKDTKLDHVLVEAKGTIKEHDIKIDLQSQDQTASTHLSGRYEAYQWLANVDSLTLGNTKQRWTLNKPFRIVVDRLKIMIEQLFLVTKDSQIVLEGNYFYKNGPQGKLQIKNLDISHFNFLLPETTRLEGKINVNADINLVNRQLFKFTAELKPSAIYYTLNNELQKIEIKKGDLATDLKQSDLVSHANIYLAEGFLVTDITAANVNKTDIKQQKIAGKLNLQLSNIKFLELLVPVIKNVAGNLKGSYQLAGTLSKPLLQGNLELSQGAFRVPKINLQISHVNLVAKSDMKNVYYKGNLSSGNGILSVTGSSQLGKEQFPVNLDLQGNNLLICNQPEIKIYASPKMQLQLVKNDLKLTGNLFIPEASLHPHDFESGGGLSDDIIFVTSNGKQIENSNLKISSSIKLVLGNNINLNSHGIKGQVQGQVQIEDEPTKATVAYGQLWLQDGSYKIYGKTLAIDSGKLIFTGGPISNPAINIKASRSLPAGSNSLFTTEENIKVGVSATGTLNDPKITLFSEPAGKSSEDILSYLIIGMPVSSINKSIGQANTQLLLQAADAINLNGNNKLSNLKDKLKKSLGLAEFGLGTQSERDPNSQETIQHTAFILGKYLSPKFYVNYSLDLFDHTNTFKIRYLLNKFWTIQSVANTKGSGVDILYTVERK